MMDETDFVDTHIICSHCGIQCEHSTITWKEDTFCCEGCKMVFQLLAEHELQDYYRFENQPGISIKDPGKRFDYLDDPEVQNKLIGFRESGISRIQFEVPSIHCSSCLWLLENLHRLIPGVRSSRVNFQKKQLTILFDEENCSLRSLVEMLHKIGYAPELNYHKLEGRQKEKIDRGLLYRLGLAGFAFGNIMLLSFPEYLGFHKASFHFYIGYINIILAIPVLVYSGSYYLESAWKGLKMKQLNIDVPVALGMLALFSRSIYEIVSHTGEGYLDSFAGFVFFLLIGRWFQALTYQSIDFDRNYKSYFPISVMVRDGGEWLSKSLSRLKPGQYVRVKSNEIIPADGVLMSSQAAIDYSFVTGEAEPILKEKGQKVLAGGRQTGGAIDILLSHSVDQSYLTQLWKADVFSKNQMSKASRLINAISKYFTISVLIIAFLSFLVWMPVSMGKAFQVLTAVLIVACPCALALSMPFTFGNMLRILSKKGMYLRNIQTIEHFQDVDHIVLDKTGTITDSSRIELEYSGKKLSEIQLTWIRSVCASSNHPLSKAMVRKLDHLDILDLQSFTEIGGQGIKAEIEGHFLKIGSDAFIFNVPKRHQAGVHVEIDDEYFGFFKVSQSLRKNVKNTVRNLRKEFQLSLLSGDQDTDRERMQSIFQTDSERLLFNQSPKNKLEYIKSLQQAGETVLMIGDGLNDAGALKQSDVGLVISDNANNFSPSCDAILKADLFPELLKYFRYIRKSKRMIYGAFTLAFMYNAIGLYFAIGGILSPVVAAILMPLSSITIISYGLIVSAWTARATFGK
jgi:Cu+-exporting ATPase